MLDGSVEDLAPSAPAIAGTGAPFDDTRRPRFCGRVALQVAGIPASSLSTWCERFAGDLDGDRDHLRHAPRRYSVRDLVMLAFAGRLRRTGMPSLTAAMIARRMMPVFDAVMTAEDGFTEAPVIKVWKDDRGWRHQLYFEGGKGRAIQMPRASTTIWPILLVMEVMRGLDPA